MNKNFEKFYDNIKNNQEINEIWKDTIIEINKKSRKASIIATILVIIIDIFIIIFLNGNIPSVNINFNNFIPFIFIFTFILIIDSFLFAFLHIILFSETTSKYNEKYKEIVLDGLLKNFFKEVDYIPKKSMPEHIYNEGKYESYDNYSSDDYMEAIIDNNYMIKMADILTEDEKEVEDSDGEKKTVITTVFSGLFAKIDIGKSINNELRISANNDYSEFDGNSMQILKMDSQEFEKYFDVSTTDKIVGMQLLTHDIMELLIKFRKYLKKDFDIYIKDNKIYIRLHVGEMFEPKLNKNEVVDKDKLYIYYNVVEFIYLLAKNMIELIEKAQI